MFYVECNGDCTMMTVLANSAPNQADLSSEKSDNNCQNRIEGNSPIFASDLQSYEQEAKKHRSGSKMMDLIKFNSKQSAKCDSNNEIVDKYRNFNLDRKSNLMQENSDLNDCQTTNDETESVLSVGREDNNYDSDRDNVEMDDIEERIPNKRVSRESQEISPKKPDPVSKLNLEEIKLSFRNIHNHLSSIKNYPNFTIDPSSLWKLPAFNPNPYLLNNSEPAELNITHLPPNLNHDLLHRNDNFYSNGRPLRFQDPNGIPLINSHEINEANLKFSIDNILKADFGRRRITDPINKLRVKHSANSSTKQKLPPSHFNAGFGPSNPLSPSSSSLSTSSSPILASPPPPSVASASSGMFSPMDLTNASPSPVHQLLPKQPTLTSSNNSSRQQNGTGSDSVNKKPTTGNTPATSEAGGPMVWPAWVYCTRYSDRPSSGEGKLVIRF